MISSTTTNSAVKPKPTEIKYNAINVPDNITSSSKNRPLPALSAVKGSFQSRFKSSPYNSPTTSSLSRAASLKTPSTASRPTPLAQQQRSAAVYKTPSMRSMAMGAAAASSAARTPSIRNASSSRPGMATPSTSSYASASKSRTPVQVINKQYKDAKKRLSRTVDCARTSIRRSIRILHEPSSKSLWRKGLLASGTKIPVYNGNIRTYPATEGKMRTLPKQEGSTVDSIRRSTKGRRSSRFGLGDMEQGCFLITPKVMRKLFATATNVASIDETDEAADEPIKVHSVKPSSLFKYLFSDISKSSESKVLLEDELKCKLESVNEIKPETPVAQEPTTQANLVETVKKEEPDQPVAAEHSSSNPPESIKEPVQSGVDLLVTIKKSQSSYEFAMMSREAEEKSQANVEAPVESIATEVKAPESPAEPPVPSNNFEDAQESLESSEAVPVTIQPEPVTPTVSQPKIEEVIAPVQYALEASDDATSTQPDVIPEPVVQLTHVEVIVDAVAEDPVQPVEQQNEEPEKQVDVQVELVTEPIKEVDLTVNYQMVPESTGDDQELPNQDVSQTDEMISKALSESVKIVDESVVEEEEPVVEIAKPVEKPIDKSILEVSSYEGEEECADSSVHAVEESVYVEILSESIQCDFGDQSIIALGPKATQSAACTTLIKIEESSDDQVQLKANDQDKKEEEHHQEEPIVVLDQQAANLMDQLVQITQNVRLSRTPLKESNQINVSEEADSGRRSHESKKKQDHEKTEALVVSSTTETDQTAAKQPPSSLSTKLEAQDPEDLENVKRTPARRGRRKKEPIEPQQQETPTVQGDQPRVLTRAQRAKLNL